MVVDDFDVLVVFAFFGFECADADADAVLDVAVSGEEVVSAGEDAELLEGDLPCVDLVEPDDGVCA